MLFFLFIYMFYKWEFMGFNLDNEWNDLYIIGDQLGVLIIGDKGEELRNNYYSVGNM